MVSPFIRLRDGCPCAQPKPSPSSCPGTFPNSYLCFAWGTLDPAEAAHRQLLTCPRLLPRAALGSFPRCWGAFLGTGTPVLVPPPAHRQPDARQRSAFSCSRYLTSATPDAMINQRDIRNVASRGLSTSCRVSSCSTHVLGSGQETWGSSLT